MNTDTKDIRLPFYGEYGYENSKSPVTQPAGNFMWFQMGAFHWYHQDVRQIKNTIKQLEDIIKDKERLVTAFKDMIDDFDWSHMFSDDGRPSRLQAERNKRFDEALAKCPDDVKFEVYKAFIREYLEHGIYGKTPMSFEEFKKGVNV